MDINSLSHSKWNCKYHIVFAPKFRRKIAYGQLKQDIANILSMLCKRKGVKKVEAEIYSKTFIKGDILLMNSDGLTNMIKENEIFEIIKKYNIEESKDDIAKILVKKANENGGLDNITVIVINNQ